MYSPQFPRLESPNYVTPPPFLSSRWNSAREYRRRIQCPPQVDPRSDASIYDVEQSAEFWVRQLVLAMINLEDIKDTENSSATKMFRLEAYDSLLLEATCREIFLALIDRCKSGFRGPAQFNKALKPNRGLEADATASCAERMQNVVNALMWNKRVCKDVLFEDWKIRLLVNHPLSYDKEKDSQKGSNDQRRKRLEAEREKLKKTEEELLVYRSSLQS
jgi:superfamily II helicase